jgi:hypothetical protein
VSHPSHNTSKNCEKQNRHDKSQKENNLLNNKSEKAKKNVNQIQIQRFFKKMSTDDAALAAAKAEKAKAREQKKLKYMRPQQRVEYNRQQQQQRKLELVRDKAKAAVAREHPSMVDLIEKYENDTLPYQATNDDDDDDNDNDDDDKGEQPTTTKKRKQTTTR